jgi:hypothetical protein
LRPRQYLSGGKLGHIEGILKQAREFLTQAIGSLHAPAAKLYSLTRTNKTRSGQQAGVFYHHEFTNRSEVNRNTPLGLYRRSSPHSGQVTTIEAKGVYLDASRS